VLEGLWLKTKKTIYKDLYHMWVKVFLSQALKLLFQAADASTFVTRACVYISV
jgi:hypothetical protein